DSKFLACVLGVVEDKEEKCKEIFSLWSRDKFFYYVVTGAFSLRGKESKQLCGKLCFQNLCENFNLLPVRGNLCGESSYAWS
ncbi:hypothetical protein KI387_015250, partial [Taxus chinensis]